MKTVIYVEDDPTVSGILLPPLCEYFATFGHEVLHFTEGQKAIDAIKERNGNVALLITDLALADNILGLDVSRVAMKNGIGKIFVFSTSAEAPETNDLIGRFAQKYGASYRLRNKPAQPATILNEIRDLLEQ